MAADWNDALVNATLDYVYDTHFPAGSVLEFRTEAPAGADNAAAGVLLGAVTSPASPWAAASGGFKAKSGAWTGTTVAAGIIGHYRFRNAADTRREEGTITATGGPGDATVDDLTVSGAGLAITVTSFTKRLP